MKFTADQQRAIDHRVGNLQLIACAGSGKTEVVARRVANLLEPRRDGAIAPRNIIAFTFTDKAAADLSAHHYPVPREDRRSARSCGNVRRHYPRFLP
jgi:DNA helicase-2/ATP-dependent DNA helicase PcrA